MQQKGHQGLVTKCSRKLLKHYEYKALKTLLQEDINKHPTAVAIASNQLLINQDGDAPAAFLTKEGDMYINPTYKAPSLLLKTTSREQCLSDMSCEYEVQRYHIIQAQWYHLTPSSRLVRETQVLCGQEAVVFQHETDHLNGIPIWLGSSISSHSPSYCVVPHKSTLEASHSIQN